MSDQTYQIHNVEGGTHILVFEDEGGGQVFQRKIFVSNSEFHPDSIAHVLAWGYRALYSSSHEFVVKWLKENQKNEQVKMVGIGKDFQILSVAEYLELYSRK